MPYQLQNIVTMNKINYLRRSMLKMPHLCILLTGDEPPSTGVGENDDSEDSGNAKLAENAIDSALPSYQS